MTAIETPEGRAVATGNVDRADDGDAVRAALRDIAPKSLVDAFVAMGASA